jgi:hypothetical protein
MMRRGFAALVWAVVLTAAVSAAQLQVTPLPRDGRVLVSFKLANAFTDEIRAAVHSGLTISFVYRIDLKRSSALWLDSTIATTEITATVRYDNLTRVYHVTRTQDGRIERAETTEREEDARTWLTSDFDKLPLFSSAALEANSEYYVRVRAHTTPRNASFVWPWVRHDVTGQTKFTFVQ